ncbi:hypothetical protein VTN77DRAFT_3113 [Rasamsonia byssochlamydoides]|uniref:uncharacterized protein n=1 Tax=Rasamsonia byssochlamydoides TaxID=89139 RepID=UPI00374489B6
MMTAMACLSGEAMEIAHLEAELGDSIIDEELRCNAVPQSDSLDVLGFSSSVFDALPSKIRMPLLDFLTKPQLSTLETWETQFNKFASSEVLLSSSESGHLVRPSGRLDAALGILLHYPTFASSQINNGETMDMGDPCIRSLARKIKDISKCLLIDRYCRRSSPHFVWHYRH